MVRIVVPEFAFETGLSTVRRTIDVAPEADNLVELVDFSNHLATDRAVCANRRYLFLRLLPLVVAFNQSSSWTYIYARATELASGLHQRSAVRGTYQRDSGALHKSQRDIPTHFVAHPDASSADYAQVVIAVVERVVSVYRQLTAVVVQRRPEVKLNQSHSVFEFAPLILRANRATVRNIYVPLTQVLWSAELNTVARQTAVWMLRHQHFDYAASQFADRLVLRLNSHVRHRSRGARRDGHLPAVRLSVDNARPARAVRLHVGKVAEIRNVDSRRQCSLQNRLSRFCVYGLPVYRELDRLGHITRLDLPDAYGWASS